MLDALLTVVIEPLEGFAFERQGAEAVAQVCREIGGFVSQSLNVLGGFAQSFVKIVRSPLGTPLHA